MWQYNRKKKNHVEISWPAVVSVYSSHIRNVDLLNSNTGWFLTKLRSKKWYFLPLGWHNCDQCLGAVPGSVGQDRSKYNESAGSYLFCQSLCQLWLQSTHRQTMVFWHNWRSKQRHSVSSLKTRYVWTHTDGHLAFMEAQEENMQTARLQYGVHTWFHTKNVNWILVSKQTIFFFHWRYSPLWALACRTMPLNFSLSITNSSHLLTPVTWTSLSTSSLHPFLGKTDNTFSCSLQLSVDIGK